MAQRSRREYLQLLDAAKAAAETAVDAFNRVWHPYRQQTTLLLMTNAWELLAKAVLVQRKESIVRGRRGETISAEVAVHRLMTKKVIAQDQAETIQQVISLRHAACHHVLPDVPAEVMQHLLFYSCKFFREVVSTVFPAHLKSLSENYLSLSFTELTTYADRVMRSVSRVKKSAGDRRLVWLLERGIQFDGSQYLTEVQFESKYKGKYKVLPHLALSGFLRRADMVRIVPIQAPRNYTADVILRKGSPTSSSLPVVVKKTDVEADYPFLTNELGQQLGKGRNWTAKACAVMNLKGDPRYHQPVRSGKTTVTHRYSQAALDTLKKKVQEDPGFNPYRP